MNAIQAIMAVIGSAAVLVGIFLLGRRSTNRRGISATDSDHDRLREYQQRTGEDLERAEATADKIAAGIQRATDDNQRLEEDNKRAEDLIREGKAILENAWGRK